MIYLDNAATTMADPRVLDAMLPYLKEEYGNPGTLYGVGRRARAAVEEARASVAKLIGAKPEQIVFTSGGTEGNNMVFSMVLGSDIPAERPCAVVSSIEHSSVLKSARHLSAAGGISLTELPVDATGAFSEKDLRRELARNPCLVSMMYVNNEIGLVNPVAYVSHAAHRAGALFHTDCVQALACRTVDVNEIDCDFATISSHKIHGPKGVGALYIRDKSLFSPMIFGGAGQEFGLRGGTENVAGIVGFGKACQLLGEEDPMESAIFTEQLKNGFCGSLLHTLALAGADDAVVLNGVRSDFGTKALNFRADGVDAETLILMLDSAGVCISAGSACNSTEQVPSHVLKAIGLTDAQARSSFRVSFSKMNNLREVEIAGKTIADCILSLRGK